MKKNLTALVLALGLVSGSSVLAADDERFTDVPSDYWANKYISAAAANGWVSGVGNNQYNPSGTVTFAQYVVMLTRAFYPEEVTAAKTEHTEIDAWWYPYAYVARSHGMFEDTEIGMDLQNQGVWNGHVLGLPISRYDMAILMANVLKDKGYTVTDAEKQAVQAKISDWSQIGDLYQDEVSSVYALGVITGTSNGSFNGNGNMTRAQAAVTLYRLNEVITNDKVTSGSEDEQLPYENSTDNTGSQLPTTKDDSSTATTTYAPADVNHDGVLTEEEVYNALMKVKEEYPEDTPWGSDKEYRSEVGWGKGCAAFAYMASDRAFTGPKRVVKNINDVRVGDIYHFKKGSLEHWGIITQISTDFLHSVSGNVAGVVSWIGYATFDGFELAMKNGHTTVYTRYPN